MISMNQKDFQVKPNSLTYDMIMKVWQKGRIVNGHNPKKYRKDVCGAWIMRDKFGCPNSVYGWDIDLIESEEDAMKITNMRPLQRENRKAKIGDQLICKVKAAVPKNVGI